jgi:hypothetical protein
MLAGALLPHLIQKIGLVHRSALAGPFLRKTPQRQQASLTCYATRAR